MATEDARTSYLLLSIAFSHFNEKARWAFSYYGVPYTHHLLLPAFHILSVKPIVDAKRAEKPIRKSSPYSTPCLAIYDKTSSQLTKSIHDSHEILVYLSEKYSTSERPNLYLSCGPAKEEEIKTLERRYGEGIGVAAREFAYYDMLVLNTWGSLLDFALLGFKNGVGLLQAALWFLFSPLLSRVLIREMKLTADVNERAMRLCRDEFKHASELLEKSQYLAGSSLSAADISFAALTYPVLSITHEDGYQLYPPSSKSFSPQGIKFQNELRATKAGQHVLRLYKEERYFGTTLPRQKKTLLGLW